MVLKLSVIISALTAISYPILSPMVSTPNPVSIIRPEENTGNASLVEAKRPWWKDAVIYQIYLRSYQDSNHDGIGDIQGLKSRLPYLRDLGVDALWLSPIHPSPDYDFGYDVGTDDGDYYAIHPKYGSLNDFKELVAEAKKYGLKIILDLVINHTSDQHQWFKESRSSRTNPKRDWYIWADNPNNWRSRLDESAWEHDPQTNQYYMHSFFKEQPDLNWRNPFVRAEIAKIMHFWLKKGVAGFRLDLANYFLKHPELKDNPDTDSWGKWAQSFFYKYHAYEHLHDKNFDPDLINAYRDLRKITDEYDGVLIAESDNDDNEAEYSAQALGEKLDGLHLAFNFKFLKPNETPFKANAFAETILEWEHHLPKDAQPTYTFNNHDRVRSMSVHGGSEKKAKLAAMVLLTLKGTPVLYYGEEIGMKDAQIPWGELQDPMSKIMIVGAWMRYMSELAGNPHNAEFPVKRDECRTPMLWDDGTYAGFSDAKPWVAMSERTPSVQTQKSNPNSMLTFYRKLLAFRKAESALRLGTQKIHTGERPDVLIYSRQNGSKTLWIALNFGDQEVPLNHPSNPIKIHLSTYAGEIDAAKLRPLEGIIWEY